MTNNNNNNNNKENNNRQLAAAAAAVDVPSTGLSNEQITSKKEGEEGQQLINNNKNNDNNNPYKALFDSIPQSGLKCDILFVVIRNRIKEEQEYVKKLRVVFQFNITKNNQLAAIWTSDTKTTIEGDIYRSAPKPGLKADCILTVDDDDWVKIMVGKLNPQRAFMMSKFKIKGNIMLLQKLHAIWFEMRRKGRTPELDLIQEIMVNEPLLEGLKSEAMAIEIVQRLVRSPQLIEKLNSNLQVNILKQKKLMTSYLIGLRAGKKPEFKRLYNAQSQNNNSNSKTDSSLLLLLKPDVILTIEDDDLVLLIYGIYKIDQAIKLNKLKVEGDKDLIEHVKQLFEQPPIMAKL